LGRRSYELAEHYLKTIFKTRKIRLGVSDDNDVSAFWKKMGFTLNGKSYAYKGENRKTQVRELEKTLDP
jgi:hypothetical protein